jgi:hypothetical protein
MLAISTEAALMDGFMVDHLSSRRISVSSKEQQCVCRMQRTPEGPGDGRLSSFASVWFSSRPSVKCCQAWRRRAFVSAQAETADLTKWDSRARCRRWHTTRFDSR